MDWSNMAAGLQAMGQGAAAMQSMQQNAAAMAAARQAVQQMFHGALNHMDRNQDGTFSSEDLPPSLRYAMNARLDRNGDGVVDARDLAPLLSSHLDRNHDGKIDLRDLGMQPGDLANVPGLVHSRMDANNDGVVDARDLPALLRAAGGVSIDQLPPALRSALLSTLDTDHDGTLSMADLAPVMTALSSSRTGAALIAQLGDGHGHYSPQQLLLLYTNLSTLARRAAVRVDGTVDLSGVAPSVRSALLADLDADGDGKLTPADLDPLLAALRGRNGNAVDAAMLHALDRDGDGILSVADVPPEVGERLRGLDHNGDGKVNLDEVGQALAASAAADWLRDIATGGAPEIVDAEAEPKVIADVGYPPSTAGAPGATGAPGAAGAPGVVQMPGALGTPTTPPSDSGSSALWITLAVLLVLCGLGGFLYRRSRRRRAAAIDRKQILGEMAGGPTDPVSNYVPAVFTTPMSVQPMQDAAAAGVADAATHTRNQDALERARNAKGAAALPPV